MTEIQWSAVLPIWATQFFWTMVVLATLVLVVRKTIKWKIRAEMAEFVKLLDERMEKSDALLFLTEQHTKLNELHKEQMKKNIELVKEQVSANTDSINRRLDTVPDATATAVVEKIDGHASQDGSTPKAPAYQPPPGAV